MAARHRRKKRVREAAKSKSGLRFLGATESSNTSITLGAFAGYIDTRVITVMHESLKILAGCIGNARAISKDRESEPRLEVLLGLALLAFAEGQALLMLCSAGLERSARVHMRSLYEYSVRAAVLLADKAKAEQFTLAAIAELEYLGALISAPRADIERAKAHFLGAGAAAPSTIKREKAALGGDMRTIIKGQAGDRAYGTMFAHPSMFSHGSILALDEVSRALVDVGNNFQAPLSNDGQGSTYLLAGATACCDLATKLVKHFRADAAKDLEKTVEQIIALQAEVGRKLGPPPPETA
jgi:hypothetical protein